MNVFSNGQTICLVTHDTTLSPIKAFNKGTTDTHNNVVNVGWGEGLIFVSYTASQGTFALDEDSTTTGVWTIGTLTPLQNFDNPVTLDLCFQVIDDTDQPWTVSYTIDCTECPDSDPSNNYASLIFEGIECTDFADCFSSIFACLPEFDSMLDAIAELGPAKPFLASLTNIEGWSYRAVLVTPGITVLTLEAPADMTENPCGNTCNGEEVSHGQNMNCSELLPILTGPCGVIEPFLVGDTTFDEDSFTTFDITYLISCSECLDIQNCCCTDTEDFSNSQVIIVHAEYTPDDPEADPTEGTLTFTIEPTSCLLGQSDSYHYVAQIC